MFIMKSKSAKALRRMIKLYDLEIDTELQTVKRAGRPIHLTAREFELLLLLVSSRGQIVTRRQVLAHFYEDDPEAVGVSNLVDVYIRFLRRKIDEGFWPRLILTRRGQGYVLRADRAYRPT